MHFMEMSNNVGMPMMKKGQRQIILVKNVLLTLAAYMFLEMFLLLVYLIFKVKTLIFGYGSVTVCTVARFMFVTRIP